MVLGVPPSPEAISWAQGPGLLDLHLEQPHANNVVAATQAVDNLLTCPAFNIKLEACSTNLFCLNFSPETIATILQAGLPATKQVAQHLGLLNEPVANLINLDKLDLSELETGPSVVQPKLQVSILCHVTVLHIYSMNLNEASSLM